MVLNNKVNLTSRCWDKSRLICPPFVKFVTFHKNTNSSPLVEYNKTNLYLNE